MDMHIRKCQCQARFCKHGECTEPIFHMIFTDAEESVEGEGYIKDVCLICATNQFQHFAKTVSRELNCCGESQIMFQRLK
jgi:hypothetical protein